jgi:quercetin 2,3-dioxygenase
MRTVREIMEPRLVYEGAGVLLKRSFGPDRANRFDPFLLFDHFAFNDPAEGPLPGFPTHPHRGIETVTYMLEGSVRHRDSLGNAGVIGPGDVQWMTSGRGILHEEMPGAGPGEQVFGFQLWVNLPAAQKMSAPRYQEILAASIPVVRGDGTQVRVIAGTYEGAHGPATEIAAQPVYLDVRLEPGVSFRLPLPDRHAAMAYVFEGAGTFDDEGTRVDATRILTFEPGDGIEVHAARQAPLRFMLFAGGPFGEPVAPYGPFVMNTDAEIQQALADLRNGTFVTRSAI